MSTQLSPEFVQGLIEANPKTVLLWIKAQALWGVNVTGIKDVKVLKSSFVNVKQHHDSLDDFIDFLKRKGDKNTIITHFSYHSFYDSIPHQTVLFSAKDLVEFSFISTSHPETGRLRAIIPIPAITQPVRETMSFLNYSSYSYYMNMQSAIQTHINKFHPKASTEALQKLTFYAQPHEFNFPKPKNITYSFPSRFTLEDIQRLKEAYQHVVPDFLSMTRV